MDKFIIVASQNNKAVVVHETVAKVIIPATGIQGPPGPQGPGGVGGNTLFTQSAPASGWIINHNLNTYPAVTIIIGGALVLADVAYNSLNSLTITFPSPESGLAVLS